MAKLSKNRYDFIIYLLLLLPFLEPSGFGIYAINKLFYILKLLSVVIVAAITLKQKKLRLSKIMCWLIIFEGIKLVSTVINHADLIDALGDSAAVIMTCYIIENMILRYGPTKTLKPIVYLFLFYSFINFAHVIYKFDGTDVNNNFLLGMDNRFIFYFLPMICFSIIIEQNQKINSKLTFICFCISLVSLLYTRSIAALIGISLLFLYYLLFIKKNFHFKYINHRILFLILLCFNVLLLLFNIQYLFKDIIYYLGKEPTFNGRIYLWKKGMELFLSKPLLGYGVNKELLMSHLYGYNHCHNLILNYLFEGGVILLVAFIAINIITANKLVAYKNYNTTRIVSCSILISLFLSLVDTLDYPFFYVLFLLAYHSDKLIINDERKDIGIVTFFDSTSYGAVLQSIATLKAVEKLDYSAEFIDYQNRYEQKLIKKEEDFVSFIKKILRRLAINMVFGDWYYRNKAFGNNLLLYDGKISKRKYYDIHEMQKIDNKYLLAGSDQIWNPKITNGIDEVFLLNFGSNNRKISFSSSMGSYKLNLEESKIFQKDLKNFSDISVREKYVKKSLKFIKDKNIKITCDPTLLFTDKQWVEMLGEYNNRFKSNKENYILTFFAGDSSDEYVEYIDYLKAKTKLKVYNIHKNKYTRKSIDKSLAGVSVPEFVFLMKNAKYVITDSFHGVAFSLIFKKKFIPVSNKSNPVRVNELLKQFNLDSMIDNKDAFLYNIDYKNIERKLQYIRNDSLKYLKQALGSDKNA